MMLIRLRNIPIWVSFWLIYAFGTTLLSIITYVSLKVLIDLSIEARVFIPVWVWPALATALNTGYLIMTSVLVIVTSNNTKYAVCSKVSRVTVIVMFVVWLVRSYESYHMLKAVKIY